MENTAVVWPLGRLSRPRMVRLTAGLRMPSVSPEAAGTVSTARATPRHHRARRQSRAITAVMTTTRGGSPSQVSAVSPGDDRPSWPWIQWSTDRSNGPAWVWPAYLIPSAVTTAAHAAMIAMTAARARVEISGPGGRGGRLVITCRQRPHAICSVYEPGVTGRVRSVLQGRVQGDVDTGEGLADRAAGLGRVGRLGELLVVEPVDLTADGELDAGQLETTGRVGAEGDVGLYVQSLRGAAGLADQRAQLHGVAGRVGGGDELLRARGPGGRVG